MSQSSRYSYSRSRSRSPGQASDSDQEYLKRRRRHNELSESDYHDDTDCSLIEQDQVEPLSEGGNDDDKEEDFDFTDVVLCHQHKPGFMTRDCQTCARGLKLISDDKVIKKLLAPEVETMKSGLVSRFAGRCDETTATMFLSSSMVEVASQVFSKGTFKDSRMWMDLVKKYLILPPVDHDKLSTDIKTEDFISRFKREKRFKVIFRHFQEMLEALRNLRIAQRPLFAAIDMVNTKMMEIKKIATEAGVQFPHIAPVRSSDLVPRNGRTTLDDLKTSSFDSLFPRPDLADFIREAGLNHELSDKLVKILVDYRGFVTKGYKELYEATADTLTRIDDYTIFYLDLYSHVDSMFRDLTRNKVASLFKADVRTDLLKQSSSGNLMDKPEGLFGGKDIIYYP